jgi:hypothetical protein
MMSNKGRFTDVENLVAAGDWISSDSYTRMGKEMPSLTYTKRDFLFRSGSWRNRPVPSGIQAARESGSRVLLVGHSDYHTPVLKATLAKFLSGVDFIAGVNVDSKDGLSEALPLGVANPEPGSSVHALLSNQLLMSSAAKTSSPPSEFDGSIYGNFSVGTNPQKRLPLVSMLERSPKRVVTNVPQLTPLGRTKYLQSLRTASLVVCPEGNGVDTFRLWETLYMGGTPVVLRHKALNRLLQKFPVIQVDSWEEILDERDMQRRWEELDSFVWDWEMLSPTYWATYLEAKLV